jgi:homocysteine S-methyltransferase
MGSTVLQGIRVIDGGLASELEYRGARIDGPLWSAHVLEDEPEILLAVHRAYIEAGAQAIATCSYQVSRMGYVEYGLPGGRADRALLRSVELARQAAAEYPERRVLVAASLGPYGAALHNGAEYHGDYDCTHADLVRFHRERIEVLRGAAGAARPDLLAFETFPSLPETEAAIEALAGWPEMPVWFSFTCRDEQHCSHGEPLAECARVAGGLGQTVAVGVNCLPLRWAPGAIAELRKGTEKPVLVYPNSGEGWDAANRCWIGQTDPGEFGAGARQWYAAGAQLVGGCCRTRPEHIRAVARVAAELKG